MKSTGIMFSSPMIIADLKGIKSQTRRTRGLNKVNENPDDWRLLGLRKYGGVAEFCDTKTNALYYIKCPYGGVGDEIWIKETFATEKCWDNKPISFLKDAGDVPIWYKTSDPLVANFVPCGRWRSSMFMPKWASRRSHILTNIRCERVQSITEADAIKEGIKEYENHTFGLDDPLCCMGRTPIIAYMRLWDFLNGKKYPWSKNVWVWALEWEA